MAKRPVSRHPWWRQGKRPELETGYVVSEAELLNRVLLAKALIAYCGGQSVHFKTDTEDLEITPRIASDLMRKAGLRTYRD